MNRKLLAFFIPITLAFHLLAIEQEVTLSSVGKDDFQVRLQAKNQALLDSLDKLPSIIWGEESLKNEVYSEQLQSIGYTHARVTVINEIFDRQNNLYTLTANVDYDEKTIIDTLSKVKEGRLAQKTLDKIRDVMRGVDIERYVKTKDQPVLPSYVEARLFSNPYFYAQTHAQMVSFHQELIDQFSQILSRQVMAYIARYSVKMVNVTKDHFIYQITGPSIPKELTLVSPELQTIYDDYATEISKNAGGVCLFSPLQHAFFELPNTDQTVNMTIKVNEKYAHGVYPELLYQSEMQAIELVYCDAATLFNAIELRRAKGFMDVVR